MTLEVSDFLVLIGFTTTITTATTTGIMFKFKDSLSKEICGHISRVHERINDVAIRLGIVENDHKDC